MSEPFAVITDPGRAYRIARKPDAWRWPDWAAVGPDGTFGNRWDDPDGVYRVLYACSERLGAFVETLARFRSAPEVVSGLADIEGADDPSPAGLVPATWLRGRLLGVSTLRGCFVDVSHADSLAVLHRALVRRLVHYGIQELDAATVRMRAPRRFTQEISRFLYEQTLADGRPAFAGIFYRSRLGDNFRNWALFERPDAEIVSRVNHQELVATDADLLEALRLLGLTFRG